MRQLGRTYAERVAKEASQRAGAKLCPPHPRSQLYMSKGDYWTRTALRCGRCGRDVDLHDEVDEHA